MLYFSHKEFFVLGGAACFLVLVVTRACFAVFGDSSLSSRKGPVMHCPREGSPLSSDDDVWGGAYGSFVGSPDSDRSSVSDSEGSIVIADDVAYRIGPSKGVPSVVNGTMTEMGFSVKLHQKKTNKIINNYL